MRARAVLASLTLLGCSAQPQSTAPARPAPVGHMVVDGQVPHASGYIILRSSASDYLVARAPVDSAGRFTLPLVHPGDYRAEIFVTGYTPSTCLLRVPDDLSRVINVHLIPNLAEPAMGRGTSIIRCVASH